MISTTCQLAAHYSDGRYKCKRESGHEGPCAPIPASVCQNCGEWVRWGRWCKDCVRAFAKGAAATMGGTIAGALTAWLIERWL